MSLLRYLLYNLIIALVMGIVLGTVAPDQPVSRLFIVSWGVVMIWMLGLMAGKVFSDVQMRAALKEYREEQIRETEKMKQWADERDKRMLRERRGEMGEGWKGEDAQP